MKLRKLNRNIHRDLGYIFFFLTMIYGLSGIALNHRDNWNPSYIIKQKELSINPEQLTQEKLNKESLIKLTTEYAPGEKYKTHFSPDENTLKIFIKDGNIQIDLQSGQAILETSKRRPVFHQFNFLHYNPIRWWTIIADIYAISLMVLAISGLFILKGKNGIKGRGAWLASLGIVIPIAFLLIFYWKIF